MESSKYVDIFDKESKNIETMEKKIEIYEQVRNEEDKKIGNALEAYKVGKCTKQECVQKIEDSVMTILNAIDEAYGGKYVMADIRV